MTLQGTDAAGREAVGGQGVLRRLLAARNKAETGAGRAPQLPQPAPQTPGRAAATAVGRAADRLYRLGVQPVAVTPGALTLAELPELLPAPALLVVLQGPGELVGMAALCPETVVALTEIQTLGRVTSRASERRRLTRSDAMICADFVNALMAELAGEMAGVEGFDGIKGYRYATWLDDPRPLSLMLEDRAYRSIDFNLRLGGAETRDSRIFIALPQPPGQDRGVVRPESGAAPRVAGPSGMSGAPERDGAVVAKSASSDAPSADRDAAPQPCGLAAVVRSAPVEVVGVLCRRRMSLGELRGLTAGRILTLPRVSLNEARVETLDGQLLAIGKFGEAEGCHAIRLRDPNAIDVGQAEPQRQPQPCAPAQGGALLPGIAGGSVPAGGAVEPPIDDLTQPDAFRDGRVTHGSYADKTADPAAGKASKAASGA